MDREVKKESTPISYMKETGRKFLDRETAGGLLLIFATLVALVLANTGVADIYHHYLTDEIVIGASEHLEISLSVEEWINDGLMVIFFLVAGLELKREVMVGELSNFKKASMPIFAALGGMLVPALLFFLFNLNMPTAKGWGIPMATDIAYSLGILGLLGKRVPVQLKIFLVALAIADDIGAILVIAIFYSSQIAWMNLLIAGGALLILAILNKTGIKHLSLYILLGIVLWLAFLDSGIHPTLAGVLFSLTIPIKPKLESGDFQQRTKSHVQELEKIDLVNTHLLTDKKQQNILETIRNDTKHTHPPLLRLENALTGFNAFFIIPVFALANAGVELSLGISEVLSSPLGLGILTGLVLGKVCGITAFSYLGAKLGFARLPVGLRWKHIVGVGLIAGIGFTMSLFITNLAFADENLVQVAKISILLASLVAAIAGVLVLSLGKTRSAKQQELGEVF
ncbi:Na+/H+ antiporter NhaA [Salinimicrobium sp. CDJ15-81-2]|jgi:NhaA family Na+:H+ antiporter|uniref:Na(+)/H(+) antiporter NhaA n=3 Tax=Flavobacteriaceae TaxID=49546 RepID=A0A9X3CX95_9FLAO|nr:MULTISPECIES: Na+/H+ antiporter NhaA [Flavobacteriaceae]MDX1601846.1 Na+/H+ antiporter NhaA [Salinimicrobium sediminis]NJY63508.1 Na+/H+ antiporter NhaA [Salinimicrobium nanhaiense]MCX2838435.1 Na+/H+ antiporter NhaA [Salinimicrobium profundisediminis]MDT0647088.1 Na+/H+ antiporter NhaA [Zunongwangia sp. F260]NJW52167.1 Na+/H+ antiporter NhaA [Salinimicrobium oceani]